PDLPDRNSFPDRTQSLPPPRPTQTGFRVRQPRWSPPAMSKLTATLLPVLLFAAPAAAQENFIPWANKFFTGRGDTPPPVILHDFGTLPKGTVRTYRFKMTNIYAYPVHVSEPKPSCGCVSIIEYTGKMEPRDTGHIDIKIDTSRV